MNSLRKGLSQGITTFIEWESKILYPVYMRLPQVSGITPRISVLFGSLILLLHCYVEYNNFQSYSFATLAYHIVLLIGTSYFTYLLTSRSPGTVKDVYSADAKQQYTEIPVCESCSNIQPMRTVHCGECNTCVLRMDHHNYFLKTCIGAHNVLNYIGLLGCFGFLLSSLATWHCHFLFYDTIQSTLGYVYMFILFVVFSLCSVDAMCIFLSATFKMFVNITTFELKNNCSYMIRKPRLFNPFDRGMENNGPECYRGYRDEMKLWTSLVYSRIAPENSNVRHQHKDACCSHDH